MLSVDGSSGDSGGDSEGRGLRILFLSNLFPPDVLGGYELGCADVRAGLAARGHETAVLARQLPSGVESASDDVRRELRHTPATDHPLRSHGWEFLSAARANRRAVQRVCREFEPDVLYLWNLGNIPIDVYRVLNESPCATALYAFDEWPNSRQQCLRDLLSHSSRRGFGGMVKGFLRRLLRYASSPPSLPLGLAQYASRFLERRVRDSLVADQHEVIPFGLRLDDYRCHGIAPVPRPDVLYIGQVAPNKGVHVAIQALADPRLAEVRLTIAGPTPDEQYLSGLRALVAERGLGGRVAFVPPRPRAQLAELWDAHDVMVFPSQWEEPFGIAPLEAMASGLAVVGTARGGSADFLRHEDTALVYDYTDADSCAGQLVRLFTEPGMAAALGRRARECVDREFSFVSLLDGVESSLERAVARRRSAGGEGTR